MMPYYTWHDRTHRRNPWDRDLGPEFARYEWEQIQKAAQWAGDFIKPNNEGPYPPVELYTVEIPQLPAHIRAQIALTGGAYFGLSSLRHTLVNSFVAFVPPNEPPPPSYSRIRINKCSRIRILRHRSPSFTFAIRVDDWDLVPADRIYLDISYEARLAEKLLAESLTGGDQTLAQALAAPVMSAPASNEATGGIALSSLTLDHHSSIRKYVDQLHHAIQLLVPPEYRSLPPPKSSLRGGILSNDGVGFRVADRPQKTDRIVDSLHTPQYPRIDAALERRTMTAGEPSLTSTWNPAQKSLRVEEASRLWRSMVHDAARVDVTLPQDIGELYYADVDPRRIPKYIDDDTHIAIAHARYLHPTPFEGDPLAARERVHRDLATVISDDARQADLMRAMVQPALAAIRRLSQAAARANGREAVSEGDWRSARGRYVDNLRILFSREEVRYAQLRSVQRNPEWRAIEDVLSLQGPMTFYELYDELREQDQAHTPEQLQKKLDELKARDLVILRRDRKYVWIG